MTWPNLFNGGCLFLEVRQRSLTVLHRDQSFIIRLERDLTGTLNPACKEKLIAELRKSLKRKAWQPKLRTVCAIDARGVSVRRLSLPASASSDLQRVLRLQIESEFPLPPESLAWGYCRLGAQTTPAIPGPRSRTSISGGNGEAGDARETIIVAALKKEVIQEYARIFSQAGLSPVFTVAALARSRICPQPGGAYALLDIGRRQSEFICFNNGGMESLKVLPWGGDDITRALEQNLGISRDEAEALKLRADNGPVPNGEMGKKIHAAIGESLASLASLLRADWTGQRLYLTGRGARYREMPQRITELLPQLTQCERLEPASPDGPTAAILGLKNGTPAASALPLVLRLSESSGAGSVAEARLSPAGWLALARNEAREITAQPRLKKWARLALVLAICSLCFPYAEALLFKPFLAKRLAAIKAEKGRLAIIDRELNFLQYIKKNQSPYLDSLLVLANAAPPGTRFESISMNRRGELTLKASIPNPQQVVDFRSKLIKSGFFSSVTVEDQSPSPNRQGTAVRIAALWKSAGARPTVKIEPLPPGMPMGMPMPGPGGGGPPGFVPGPGMPGPMAAMPGGPAGADMPPNQARQGMSPQDRLRARMGAGPAAGAPDGSTNSPGTANAPPAATPGAAP
jgi:Tfp pilus assembly PilM family ATPase